MELATELQQALNAVRTAKADPVRALQALDEIERKLAAAAAAEGQLSPRNGAVKIYRVPNVPAVAAGGQSGPVPINLRAAGKVIAMYGVIINADTDNNRAGVSVSVTWNSGEDNLVTNGEGPEFAHFGALFTRASPWFPLNLEVESANSVLSCNFDNATGAPLTPALYFAFIPTSAYARTSR